MADPSTLGTEISQKGHTHVAADITDLAIPVPPATGSYILTSESGSMRWVPLHPDNPVDFSRRFLKLMRRPIVEGLSIHYIIDKLEEATAAWHNITNRQTDLGSIVDGPIIDYACALMVREGVEGVSSASEGGISRTFNLDEIIADMKENRVMTGSGL